LVGLASCHHYHRLFRIGLLLVIRLLALNVRVLERGRLDLASEMVFELLTLG